MQGYNIVKMLHSPSPLSTQDGVGKLLHVFKNTVDLWHDIFVINQDGVVGTVTESCV